jgi:Ca-activated chloride channel homolog
MPDIQLPSFSEVSFAHPWVFSGLALIPLLVFWYIKRHHKTKPDLRISSLSGFAGGKKSAVVRLMHVPFVLRCLTIMLLIAALARPQTRLSTQDMSTQGIDILMTMDLSPSMLAKDFKPNRLESAKSVAVEFIESRPADRIGLVVFSGEAYTQCPLTIDHSVLKNLLSSVEPNFLADGTAIGLGLATAVNRLRESKAAGKVIILITDGENNVGAVSPLTAAEIAREYGMRVYTIGVGSRGMAYSPITRMNGEFVFGYTEVRIDEALLKKMAEMTNGQYFRATNHEGLKDIYRQIDQLEKTRFDVTEYRKKKEEFWPLALLAVVFLAIEWLLRNTLMRSIP